jgi:hypothetical protein
MESMGSGQVMIPFDASSDPKDITKHVTTAISRVVAKVDFIFICFKKYQLLLSQSFKWRDSYYVIHLESVSGIYYPASSHFC